MSSSRRVLESSSRVGAGAASTGVAVSKVRRKPHLSSTVDIPSLDVGDQGARLHQWTAGMVSGTQGLQTVLLLSTPSIRVDIYKVSSEEPLECLTYFHFPTYQEVEQSGNIFKLHNWLKLCFKCYYFSTERLFTRKVWTWVSPIYPLSIHPSIFHSLAKALYFQMGPCAFFALIIER